MRTWKMDRCHTMSKRLPFMPWNSSKEEKKPAPECPGGVFYCVWLFCFVCVCVWASSHPWWLNRHQLELYARLLLRRGSFITFLLPLHLSLSFSCLPLAPPFTLFSCFSFPLRLTGRLLNLIQHFHQGLNPIQIDLKYWNTGNKSSETKKKMKTGDSSFCLWLIFLINSYTVPSRSVNLR